MPKIEEYVRLRTRADGPAQTKARKQAGCPNAACANHGHAPEEHVPGEYKPLRRYIKFGQSAKRASLAHTAGLAGAPGCRESPPWAGRGVFHWQAFRPLCAGATHAGLKWPVLRLNFEQRGLPG